MQEEKLENTILREKVGSDGKRGSPSLTEGMHNYIIDIDGVVCEDVPNEEPERMVSATEIPGARERINRWFDEGHVITFFTARTYDLRDITVAWLTERGFKFHDIIFNKPRGGNYHYFDDKPVKFTHVTDGLG